MNKQDVLKVIMKIEAAYNNPWTRNKSPIYRDMTDEEIIIEVVNTWYEFLKDCDADKVFDRLNRHIASNRYPPTISEIIVTNHYPSAQQFIEKYRQWEREAKHAKRIRH